MPKDGRDWTILDAKNDLSNHDYKIIPIQYRPFDIRYTVFTGKSKGFIAYPRTKITKHFIKDNIGLCLMRQFFQDTLFSHVFASNYMIDERTMYSNRGGTYLFPLLIYDSDLLLGNAQSDNFNQELLKIFLENINLKYKVSINKSDFKKHITSLDIFDYIYAILHSNVYRKQFNDFLKKAFPSVPSPKDIEYFKILSAKGEKLRIIHNINKIELPQLITSYTVDGINKVEYLNHSDNKIHINKEQYFFNISKNIWNYYIGGYQPLKKYLKDRKGRILTTDEIVNYQKIISSITETISIVKEIDEIIQL